MTNRWTNQKNQKVCIPHYVCKEAKQYKKSKYYGTYILRGGEKETNISKKRNNFFRIIDTSKERNKGQICKTETYENLIKIIKYLNPKKNIEKKIKRDM